MRNATAEVAQLTAELARVKTRYHNFESTVARVIVALADDTGRRSRVVAAALRRALMEVHEDG